MLRLTSADGKSWLEVEQTRPPQGARRNAPGLPPFFWGRITLHLPSDELGSYVAWNQPYLVDFADFFARIESQPLAEPVLHRTEDDDLVVTASRDDASVELTIRLLDWWDPYASHRSDDPRRVLEGRFTVTAVAASGFARQLQRLSDSRG